MREFSLVPAYLIQEKQKSRSQEYYKKVSWYIYNKLLNEETTFVSKTEDQEP